jgi:hypothetical protein
MAAGWGGARLVRRSPAIGRPQPVVGLGQPVDQEARLGGRHGERALVDVADHVEAPSAARTAREAVSTIVREVPDVGGHSGRPRLLGGCRDFLRTSARCTAAACEG